MQGRKKSSSWTPLKSGRFCRLLSRKEPFYRFVPLTGEIPTGIQQVSEVALKSLKCSEVWKTLYPCYFRQTLNPIYRESINYIYSISSSPLMLKLKPTAILAERRIA